VPLQEQLFETVVPPELEEEPEVEDDCDSKPEVLETWEQPMALKTKRKTTKYFTFLTILMCPEIIKPPTITT
jgi:hypothetical protein